MILAASREVLQHRDLPFVKRYVFLFFSLILDIRRHCLLTAMFSDSRDEVSVRPEFSAPELFLHFRYSSEDLSRRDAFHCTNDLRWSIGGNGLDEEVDMVLVGSYFEEMYLEPVFYVEAGFLQDHVHRLGDDDSAVFGRTDEVIDENVYVMAFVDVYTHAS